VAAGIANKIRCDLHGGRRRTSSNTLSLPRVVGSYPLTEAEFLDCIYGTSSLGPHRVQLTETIPTVEQIETELLLAP